ncbi:MAG: hypothetical protein NZ772_00335 [Cyanobacteria bacterium]|nr:hypothetical protein [Cyanobacteriota bacterium]MDW8199777.1 hypothetical protein [Cyanobacteriota bacterium SKYGB_h_bin112]
MGNSQDLPEIGDELLALGQAAYRFEQGCPDCQSKLAEFWQRLDWLENQFQKLLQVIEYRDYLLCRITRFRDFGEPLDDL